MRAARHEDCRFVEADLICDALVQFEDRDGLLVRADVNDVASYFGTERHFLQAIDTVINEREAAPLFAVSIDYRLTPLQHEVHHDRSDVTIWVVVLLTRTDNVVRHRNRVLDAVSLTHIVEEFLRAEIDFDLKGRRFVDVQNIFHKMEPRNLGAAYKFYCEKELVNAHSAEADTIATYEILKAQLDRYAEITFKDKKGNISTPVVNDIKVLSEFSFGMKNVDLIGHIVYNDKNVEVFNFGKHKGKPVAKVLKDEPSYYDWMMKGEFPLSTKKVLTRLKLRGFNNESVKLDLF